MTKAKSKQNPDILNYKDLLTGAPKHYNIHIQENIIEIKEDGNSYMSVNSFLSQNKLHVWNKAKGFNGNYKFNHPEDHASIEGHQRVANMVINHIKKLENEKR